jgi:hypothetical protein
LIGARYRHEALTVNAAAALRRRFYFFGSSIAIFFRHPLASSMNTG